jgi:hypothetical protein
MSDIKNKKKAATFLIVKNRNFYDFEIFTLLATDQINEFTFKSFGIVFRYKDPFNYYSFDISSINKKIMIVFSRVYYGKTNVIKSSSLPKMKEKFIKIKIIASAYKLSFYLDGSLIFKEFDYMLTTGRYIV